MKKLKLFSASTAVILSGLLGSASADTLVRCESWYTTVTTTSSSAEATYDLYGEFMLRVDQELITGAGEELIDRNDADQDPFEGEAEIDLLEEPDQSISMSTRYTVAEHNPPDGILYYVERFEISDTTSTENADGSWTITQEFEFHRDTYSRPVSEDGRPRPKGLGRMLDFEDDWDDWGGPFFRRDPPEDKKEELDRNGDFDRALREIENMRLKGSSYGSPSGQSDYSAY